jgi:hypothetical protein
MCLRAQLPHEPTQSAAAQSIFYWDSEILLLFVPLELTVGPL